MTNSSQTGGKDAYFLDDMYVGQRFRTQTHRIDEDQIVTFARKFDPQPFHLGTQSAMGTFFWRACCEWMAHGRDHHAFIGREWPADLRRHRRGGAEITWPNPTRPGDTLYVESEIIDLKPSRSRSDRGMATLRNETRSQNGDIVQIQVAKLIVPRRGSIASVV